MVYKFTSKRLSVGNGIISDKAPDYSNIIIINKVPFTLVGYLRKQSSDIDYKMERITFERLRKDKYLTKEFNKKYALDKSLKMI